MSRPQNWSIMIQDMAKMVHKCIVDLSTKISLSQTATITYPYAIERRVALLQVLWSLWWCADSCSPYRFQCPSPSRCRFQDMISSSSLSVQAAPSAAAGYSGASHGGRERGIHSGGSWQTCLGVCAGRKDSGNRQYSWSWVTHHMNVRWC